MDEDGPTTHRCASEEILNAVITVATTAIRHGIILDRWHDIANVMIKKIPGRPQVHKLRVIHQVKADFNLLVGILWG
jgi:pyridoxine 5'-phosphate synthase PdxJ